MSHFFFVYLEHCAFLHICLSTLLSVCSPISACFSHPAHHCLIHFLFSFSSRFMHLCLLFPPAFVVLSGVKVARHYRRRHWSDKGQKLRQKCLQTGSAGVSVHVCGVCNLCCSFTWAHQTGTEEEDRLTGRGRVRLWTCTLLFLIFLSLAGRLQKSSTVRIFCPSFIASNSLLPLELKN